MASPGSAFAPVRNSSVSSDDSDVKTTIHFPKSESSFSSPPALVPWWSTEAEGHLLKPTMWSWWGLQNQRLSSMYRFTSFSNVSDDEKPTQSYIGLIAEAILSSPEEKLILSDIYGFILANYPYFRNKGTGWRNSIRHNLSLNDCFIKAGRSQNGKGHFWAINHLYVDDFRRGDFRRKRTYKRPNRGKKARAKLDALMKKRESSCQEYLNSKNSEEIIQKEQEGCENEAQKDNKRFVADRNMDDERKQDNYMEQPHLPETSPVHAHERVVPSSPECVTDEYQEIDVCGTELEKGVPKSRSTNTPKEDLEEKDSKEKKDEARRIKSFDMDRLLAPERCAKDFGILREMYPMYYNIMNLGMRNLEPVECYGIPPSQFCGHCCSMYGSYSSPHRETRHLYTTMAQPLTKSFVSSEFR